MKTWTCKIPVVIVFVSWTLDYELYQDKHNVQQRAQYKLLDMGRCWKVIPVTLVENDMRSCTISSNVTRAFLETTRIKILACLSQNSSYLLDLNWGISLR